MRSLKLKTRSDRSFADKYQTTQQAAQTLFNQGMSDHLKAAEIADFAGLTDCSREIRELLPHTAKRNGSLQQSLQPLPQTDSAALLKL
ncbi:MAG: hypothetical protein AB4426_09250 [Xenococcaceae cyanobacterium]